MGANPRTKGQSGEREFAAIMMDYVGGEISRNLDQTRDGGHDLNGMGPFAVEVKRQEKQAFSTWWRQACTQAARVSKIPVLAWRKNRAPWVVFLPAGLVHPAFSGLDQYDVENTVQVNPKLFSMIMKAPNGI